MNKTNWTEKYLIGKVDDESIYLSAPQWDCGWYWGFGYLGNKNCHYHLDGLSKKHNANLYDALYKEFGNSLTIGKIEQDNFGQNSTLYTFCELVLTAYTLKETAEVLGRGGSHMTTNPLAELIKNEKEVTRINDVVLPAIFDQINILLSN